MANELLIPIHDEVTGEVVATTPMKGIANTGTFTIVSAGGETKTFACMDGVKSLVSQAISEAQLNGGDVDLSQIEAAITSISTALGTVSSDLGTLEDTVNDKHIPTDRFRWQDYYNSQLIIFEQGLASEGLKSDHDNEIIIGTNPYQITSEYGGIIEVVAMNQDGKKTNCTVVGQTVNWTSDGLIDGVQIYKYFRVYAGNSMLITNAVSAKFIPAIPDENSAIYRLYTFTLGVQKDNAELREDILNINARLDNLQPDTDNIEVLLDSENAIDATTNGQYTITNTLGGQLKGSGVTVLGLLGLKVLSTGTVEITLASDREINKVKYTAGQTVKVYDNTSLLGVTIPDLVIDVKDGDVITTSAMRILTFTPYKAT